MRNPFWHRSLLATATAALLVSCVSTKPDAQAPSPAGPVWPPPPAQPRLAYLQSICGPADIGEGPSVWSHVSGWFTGKPGQPNNLVKPFGIALDDQGNLCLTDTGLGAVCYCDFARKKWRRWDVVGKTRFATPVAIARKDGTFYVADSELGKVLAFRDDGQEVFEISSPLERPAALALVGDTLYVADTQTHSVSAFDLRGKLRFKFGERGSAPGEFNFPSHLSCDGGGALYVTDSMNSRVQVFDLQGKFLRQIGSAGDTSGHFGRPKGAARDSAGHVYVVDALFDNVQVFDLEGRLLLDWGTGGSGPGEFWLPNAIAIGNDNRIFVTDSYNHRVQVFKYLGGS